MDALDVSRWQFGITTVYHFILVPLTIGLAPLIAVMQTMWVITKKDHWYRLTKFFGKLFLINFALGVATGIVQEFQFGMNWSEYSRFVGDVFGAPLALEGLVAFFLESTFLGLWIFGWGRLPKLVHLATIWLVAIGVNASAFFIIAANSFMQHPVGARYNAEPVGPSCTSIWELFTNNTALAAFPHVVAGAFLTAGTFVAGIGGWWMVRNARASGDDRRPPTSRGPCAARSRSCPVGDGGLGGRPGDHRRHPGQADVRAAADEDGLRGIVVPHRDRPRLLHPHRRHAQQLRQRHPRSSRCPTCCPFLAEGKFNGVTLEGVKDLQEQYEEQFGPGNYRPNLFVTYWSFRAMIGLLAVLGAVRRGRAVDDPRRPGAGPAWFCVAGPARHPHAVPGQQRRLGVHRDGPPALGGRAEPDRRPELRLTVAQGVSDHPPAWCSPR